MKWQGWEILRRRIDGGEILEEPCKFLGYVNFDENA